MRFGPAAYQERQRQSAIINAGPYQGKKTVLHHFISAFVDAIYCHNPRCSWRIVVSGRTEWRDNKLLELNFDGTGGKKSVFFHRRRYMRLDLGYGRQQLPCERWKKLICVIALAVTSGEKECGIVDGKISSIREHRRKRSGRLDVVSTAQRH